jgi:putative membrane protein
MVVAMWGAALVAGLLHVVIFLAESMWWTKPAVYKGFLMTAEQAETTRLLAFNQGVYNLMLAVATLGGLAAWAAGYETVGLTLAAFGCLSMLVAAIALISSAPKLKRGAAVQAIPSLIFLALLLLHLNSG